MTVEDLEAALASVPRAEAPDDWALAAYRLAVAKSEAAGQPGDIEQALGLLDRAARILSAGRAPVEHGRIITAAANCHRAAGRADRALELFVRAAELLASRAPALEHAGALINVGLARCEAGQPAPAIEALNQAVDLIVGRRAGTDTSGPGRGSDHQILESHRGSDDEARQSDHHPDNKAAESRPRADDETSQSDLHPDNEIAESRLGMDDEAARLLGAALINRAQARQALGRDEDLEAAIDDYRGAVGVLPASSLQAAMAAHGLGAAVLELCRRGLPGRTADEAVGAFEQSLGVLGHASFPFHHAVARHSLALAFEMRGRPGDLARALNSAHASLAVFDPRLHAAHWRTAHATLVRLEAALDGSDPSAGRLSHVARLLADTDEAEREQLLRDRLLRAASLPSTGMRADLEAERVGEQTRHIRARPWPERPVSAANKSGNDTAATQQARTYSRSLLEALIGSLAALPLDDYREVLRTLLGVLMELPDQLLETACDVLCRVHSEHASGAVLDEALDAVINDRLFGPQRVRVRDLLEAKGWVRP